MKVLNKEYPLTVWLSTLLLAALVLIVRLLFLYRTSDFTDVTKLFFIILILSLVLSYPAYLLFNYSFKRLTMFLGPGIRLKLLLAVIILLEMSLTFFVLGQREDRFNDSLFYYVYGSCILICSLFFKITY